MIFSPFFDNIMHVTTFNQQWYHHNNQNKKDSLYLDTLYLDRAAATILIKPYKLPPWPIKMMIMMAAEVVVVHNISFTDITNQSQLVVNN